MEKFTFNRIKTRLVFWFLLLSLTPLLIALSITYFQRVHVIEVSTFDKLTAIRDLKVARLNDWLNERVGDMNSFSADRELSDLEFITNTASLNKADQDYFEKIRYYLSDKLKNYPVYHELYIINPQNGKIIAATKKYLEGEDRNNDDFFLNPMKTGALCIKDIHYSTQISELTMIYSIPIFSLEKKNKIIAVLVAEIDLQNTLYEMLLDRVGLGETGETLIVNDQVMALNELRWYDNAPLKLKIQAEPAVKAATGETGILASKDYRNEPILAAYTYIPQTKWGFVCKQDSYELNAPIRNLLFNFIILFLLSASVIIFIALQISKSISTPITNMDKIAKDFGEGKYFSRNKITTNDELGSLARELNKMADQTESTLVIQRGVVEISETMINKSSIDGFAIDLLKKLMGISNAIMSSFYILNEGSMEYEHFASIGAKEEMLLSFSAENPQGEFGNVLSAKGIVHVQDIPENTIFKFQTVAGDIIPKELISIPVFVEGTVIAIISLVSIQKFTRECIEIINKSWVSINTSYSNLVASERTRILAEHLARMNQQLEAQSEELQDQAEELQDQASELQHTSEELQEQNIELEAQRKQVEAANKLKSEFLSNMSHELRTPLNSIMALSRVLLMQTQDRLNEEESSYLEIVERNGKRLLTLINDILDLSKIEAGKMDVYPQLISVKSLIQVVKENLQSLADEKNLKMTLKIPENLPYAETDESRLHQVLTNIVGNAVKFTEKGSVIISSYFDKENISIRIQDTGIGIAEDLLPFIFDEFRQVDGTTSRQYEGTGLGLAIAKKTVGILGGHIHVDSKKDVGSVFTIEIPIKWYGKEEEQDLIIHQKFENVKLNSSILVVDDDLKTVEMICQFLKEEGYATICSTSGKEALELANKYKPFAILLDIIMEDMDGWEVLQNLKHNDDTKDIPVVIVSVSQDRKTGLALGAIGFIDKPIDKENLISQIRKIEKLPETVMLVDDNEMELKQISSFFEAENIATILANNGRECLEKLKTNKPDVIILDLVMPELDGFMVVDELRKNEKTRNIPVIVLTAKVLTQKEREKLKGSVSSLIEKSNLNRDLLLQEIKRIIRDLEKTKGSINLKNNRDAKRILMVEDNPDAIAQVKNVLEKQGYIVDVADGGQQALKYLKTNIPDGIILDLMMPEFDGFQVLDAIRSTHQTKNIPVLILTAKDLTRSDLNKLKSNNVNQLVLKGDIDIKGLLEQVKLLLGMEVSANTERSPILTTFSDSISSVKITKERANELFRVLVVEDNPDNMTTLEAILKDKYELLFATDGQLGLELALTENPDLILLDISLPMLDGPQVIEQLKANVDTKNTPIIAVTALAMKGDQEKIMELGCDGYVSKPIDSDKLLNEIRKFLN